MAYKPIADYGLIGDMNSAALVGVDGSIDWACFPRFDSPSVFAALLDDEKGGAFKIAPSHATPHLFQRYLPDTNILETEFRTPSGTVSVTDFMPVKNGNPRVGTPHEIHRIVRCWSGHVEMRCDFAPRPGYALAHMDVTYPSKSAVVVRSDRRTLTLCSGIDMTPEPLGASASFTLSEGEETRFVLAYGSKKPLRLASYRSEVKFEHTRSYWEELAASVRYEGMWRDEVVRSFLSLQLMIYEPTGAIVAAPTTSLPEGIGGSRTWDYRYAWLRDSSFTMDVLYRMGQTGKANRYLRWLLEHCKVTNGNARIVYGISMSSSLKEYTLDHLAGYRDSKPVRIGNGAESHLQLDVFGEVILGIESLYRNGGGITDDAWELVEHFADVACNNWHLKDRGVWETRGPQQHFVYSKVMCWVALDRAVALGEALGRTQSSHRWRSCADAIKAEVLERGWSDSKQAFVQSYDSEILDASALIIPFVGFLPCDHPMVSSTLDAIMRELADGPFVRRYNTQETDDGLDFQDEGAFKLLSFWLVGNLICTGRIEQATRYFEQLLGCANHVGLFAEMIDPRTGEFLGNFPQAYSHIGLIHTARNLSRALTGQPVKTEHLLPQMAFAD